MKRSVLSMLIAASVIIPGSNAFAASDYFLKIEGIEGESAVDIEVLSWSWGATNPGSATAPAGSGQVTSPRDSASGQATGRHQHHPSVTASQNTQSLRESPTRASTGQTAARATFSDLNFMRRPELSTLASLGEVQGFSVTLDKSSPILAKLCAQGTHIPKATLTARGEQWSLDHAVVSGCDAVPPAPRQTQGATFGERCVSGQCPAEMVALTITGQAKHTKTGHVTLLK